MIREITECVDPEIFYESKSVKISFYIEPTLDKRIRDLQPIFGKPTRNEMIYYLLEIGRYNAEKEAVSEGLLKRYE